MHRLSRLHFLLLSLPFAIAPTGIGSATLYSHESETAGITRDSINTLTQGLEQGDKFYEAGLTSKAIEAYRQVIKAINDSASTDKHVGLMILRARFNLSQALIAEGRFDAAAELLKENVSANHQNDIQEETVRRNSLFHLARTQKQQKNYLAAKESFTAYLSLPPPLEDKDEALFESGLIDYLSGNFVSAKEIFDSLNENASKRHIQTLGALYIARIYLAEGKNDEAAFELDQLTAKMKKDDPLFHEAEFLRGETAFRQHDYQKALRHYKNSLPTPGSESCQWYGNAQYMQGLSYIRLAETPGKKREELDAYYQQAEDSLKKMSDSSPNEEGLLALAQCYLGRVARLKQNGYYAKAEEILSQDNVFTTTEGKTHALLLRAEAAPNYALRDNYYKQLTRADNSGSTLYAKGWYMRALNDFEQGIVLLKKGDASGAQQMFEEAALAFRKTFDLTKGTLSPYSGDALKLEAISLAYTDKPEGNRKAVSILNSLMTEYAEEWQKMKTPNEVLYLHGYYAGKLALMDTKDKSLTVSAASLLAAAENKDDRFADQSLRHLGALYFEAGSYSEAEKIYLRLTDAFPKSPYVTESWVWAARCAERLGNKPEVAKERRKKALENEDGNSPFAAEAYFSLYSYQEYLQGDRTAIRHLQGFAAKYPESPYLIEANYLIGLDNKRDRKNDDGRWIRKKSLTDAIDAFHKSELLYDELAAKKLIPKDKLEYYTAMRYRATFERAMANLSIAKEAQAAKRQIYLDYAEEVFESLLADLDAGKNPYIRQLQQRELQLSLCEECTFWLAQTYIKGDKDSEAELILKGMVDGYRKNNVTRSYYLSRTLGEQGSMAMRRNDFMSAIQLLKAADEAGKNGLLSTDQRLDLSIQQSFCYRNLGQYDDAILILSKVINDDAVSSLRVKAMFLRAETYELQGRPELAKKQLESMVKKGGMWARKAQEKLEKEYINHGK